MAGDKNATQNNDFKIHKNLLPVHSFSGVKYYKQLKPPWKSSPQTSLHLSNFRAVVHLAHVLKSRSLACNLSLISFQLTSGTARL